MTTTTTITLTLNDRSFQQALAEDVQTLGAFGQAIVASAREAAQHEARMLAESRSLRRLGDALDETTDGYDAFRSAIEAQSDRLALFGEMGEEIRGRIESLSDPLERVRVAQEEWARASDPGFLQQLGMQISDTQQRVGIFTARLGPLVPLMGAAGGAFLAAGAALGAFVVDALGSFLADSPEAQRAVGALSKAWEDYKEAVGEAFYSQAEAGAYALGLAVELRQEMAKAAKEEQQAAEEGVTAWEGLAMMVLAVLPGVNEFLVTQERILAQGKEVQAQRDAERDGALALRLAQVELEEQLRFNIEANERQIEALRTQAAQEAALGEVSVATASELAFLQGQGEQLAAALAQAEREAVRLRVSEQILDTTTGRLYAAMAGVSNLFVTLRQNASALAPALDFVSRAGDNIASSFDRAQKFLGDLMPKKKTGGGARPDNRAQRDRLLAEFAPDPEMSEEALMQWVGERRYMAERAAAEDRRIWDEFMAEVGPKNAEANEAGAFALYQFQAANAARGTLDEWDAFFLGFDAKVQASADNALQTYAQMGGAVADQIAETWTTVFAAIGQGLAGLAAGQDTSFSDWMRGMAGTIASAWGDLFIGMATGMVWFNPIGAAGLALGGGLLKGLGAALGSSGSNLGGGASVGGGGTGASLATEVGRGSVGREAARRGSGEDRNLYLVLEDGTAMRGYVTRSVNDDARRGRGMSGRAA